MLFMKILIIRQYHNFNQGFLPYCKTFRKYAYKTNSFKTAYPYLFNAN